MTELLALLQHYHLQLLTPMIISFVVCFLLWRFPLAALFDRAGERSLHSGAIQRSGGFAIVIAIVVGFLLFPKMVAEKVLSSPGVVLACLILLSISILEDFRSLPPLLRLFFQVVIASLCVFEGGFLLWPEATAILREQGLGLWLLIYVLTLLAVVWGINLYNFMDGMDGFAAGMAMIGFGCFAVIAVTQGYDDFALFNLILVIAVAGFWLWNLPPARIFMGDLGSTFLGLMMVLVSVKAYQNGLVALWMPLVIFAPFWVDATYTLIKRLLKKEKFWLPHRQHFYQRLVLAGYSHRTVVLWEYTLMLAGCTGVLLSIHTVCGYNNSRFIPIIFAVLYGFLILALEYFLYHRKEGLEGN